MGVGIRGAGVLPVERWSTGAMGIPPLDFAVGTFTPSISKRATGVFAASPIVQGKWDGTGTPDVLSLSRGTLLANPTTYFYSNLDPYQGSIAFWITPEWAGNDGVQHYIYRDLSSSLSIYKTAANNLTLFLSSQFFAISVVAWTAGTRYFVVARWDAKNSLDGTNYACISVNDVHTFGITTAPVVVSPNATQYIGGPGSSQADAIIQGLTIYRRPLWDGAYGKDVGNGDEIALMHAAGVGADPCLITGSWDVCLCVPTDATPGALTTGTGNAWSHPHGSSIPAKSFLSDGGYLGDAYAVGYNGTNTSGNAGSGATLDNLPLADCTMECWVRVDVLPASNVAIIQKGYGWVMFVQPNGSVRSIFYHATTNAAATSASSIVDGKWHHVAVTFTFATKILRLWIDGVLASTSGAAVGAYVSDATDNMVWGFLGAAYLRGAVAWTRLSNNLRYTADFIPPRPMPAADGNTVEQWSMAEGTGAASIAVVTSPANDCALTNHTWERQWDQQGTPVVPQSLEFDGSATLVNCGSGATLDNIPNGATVTWDGWFRATAAATHRVIINKTSWGSSGWEIEVATNNWLYGRIELATTDAFGQVGPINDSDRWHHYALYYDDATKTARIALDGIWGNAVVGAGAYQLDAADTLMMGRRSDGSSYYFDGNLGWQRISNSDRYTGATGRAFVPPPRTNPPAVDGNTVEQWDFVDGAGTTVTALVTSPANDGAITMGSGRWWNTPCMEWHASGCRMFDWGYVLGADAANEGVLQTLTGQAAGSNYAARVPVHWGADSNGQPEIIVYDETNGAAITTFLGPQLTGLHTGGNNSPTLIAANGNFPQSLVGATVYNITDGSSATITAISGDKTTITGALAGGTDNDWDTNDVYRIVWAAGYPNHVWTETFTWELPTIARNGVAADCVSFSIRLLNALDEGTLYWHQAEIQANLIDNPSLETGAGNPWIVDGWTNDGLDPGNSVQELVTIHSGSSAIEYVVAGPSEGQYCIFSCSDAFVSLGAWIYESFDEMQFRAGQSDLISQAEASGHLIITSSLGRWQFRSAVARYISQVVMYIYAEPGGVDGFFDDLYAFGCDDVSLTVTPANQANSAEPAGLRIDGYDLCTQAVPAGRLNASQGWIRWTWTPRHAAALLVGFGTGGVVTLLEAWGNVANYIAIYSAAANTITLEFNDGGGAHVANWNCAGAIVPGTTYQFEVRYVGTDMWLIVDNVVRATITTPIVFALVPTILYWSTWHAGGFQTDAVYAAP